MIASSKEMDMLTKRQNNERGLTETDWLKSFHTFSFGHYYDLNHMGFGPLRVINEDRVIPGKGFRAHPHDNMEIISYVLEGGLVHKDSMGNGSTIRPGEIQIMSAGNGVTHSEFNPSRDKEVHFLQIWIVPNIQNESPNYQQKAFSPEELHNAFRVVISSDGKQGSLVVKQDARMLMGRFDANNTTLFSTKPERKYWLQMTKGNAIINEMKMLPGDGLAVETAESITVTSLTNTEILLFDLP